jgi:hypothetical protein
MFKAAALPVMRAMRKPDVRAATHCTSVKAVNGPALSHTAVSESTSCFLLNEKLRFDMQVKLKERCPPPIAACPSSQCRYGLGRGRGALEPSF